MSVAAIASTVWLMAQPVPMSIGKEAVKQFGRI
jgi:hypothetical protein